MSEVRLENVSKKYGDILAVNNSNLEIRHGEFMVLLGPSGCGKTTTLRLIAGLEECTDGSIYFDGEIVNDLEPKERNVAMVFQDFGLYPHMSVFDNMTLCLKIKRIPRNEIMEKLKKVAELLGIEEFLSRKPGELSGGQKQRVAVGRAIIRNPDIYLMDEPLSNLDALLRVNMRKELKKLHGRLRTTTIYVTHDQEEAMVIADRIAIMNEGTLLQVGEPRKIYNHPANLFIAKFIGSPQMNFVPCRLRVDNEGDIFLDANSFSLKIPYESRNRLMQRVIDQEIIMGIRPENVSVHSRQEQGSVPAKVYFFQQMGNIGYVDLEIGGNKITAMVRPDFEEDLNKKLFVAFNIKYLHFFDKVTEKAIL